ncbi:hypothetical protein C2U70_08110, partial [Bradyrhizobium guangdongense]
MSGNGVIGEESNRPTAASRLLAGAEIWSPGAVSEAPAPVPPPARPPAPELPAVKSPEPAPAPKVIAAAPPAASPTWPPKKLSLALQGGGTFAAFTWGVLERLLEEPSVEFDTISSALIAPALAPL